VHAEGSPGLPLVGSATEAAAEEIEVRPAKHLAVSTSSDDDMALDRAGAPGTVTPALTARIVVRSPVAKRCRASSALVVAPLGQGSSCSAGAGAPRSPKSWARIDGLRRPRPTGARAGRAADLQPPDAGFTPQHQPVARRGVSGAAVGSATTGSVWRGPGGGVGCPGLSGCDLGHSRDAAIASRVPARLEVRGTSGWRYGSRHPALQEMGL